jgi:hypothetical protein
MLGIQCDRSCRHLMPFKETALCLSDCTRVSIIVDRNVYGIYFMCANIKACTVRCFCRDRSTFQKRKRRTGVPSDCCQKWKKNITWYGLVGANVVCVINAILLLNWLNDCANFVSCLWRYLIFVDGLERPLARHPTTTDSQSAAVFANITTFSLVADFPTKLSVEWNFCDSFRAPSQKRVKE